MIAKLKGIEERYIKLEHLLSDPAVISDQKKYQKYLIEHGELNKIVPVFRVYERLLEEHNEAKELLKDADSEIRTMAKKEIPELESNIAKIKSEQITGKDSCFLSTGSGPNLKENIFVIPGIFWY